MFQPKRILVPIDFTEKSRRALDWAAEIAQSSPDAKLFLCHILPSPAPGLNREVVPYNFMDLEKDDAQKHLAEWQKCLPEGVASEALLDQAPVAPAIAELCEDKKIDLVVMTTEGRRGLPRLLQGSTTEETVRLAPCPVLVLHMNRSVPEPARRSS